LIRRKRQKTDSVQEIEAEVRLEGRLERQHLKKYCAPGKRYTKRMTGVP